MVRAVLSEVQPNHVVVVVVGGGVVRSLGAIGGGREGIVRGGDVGVFGVVGGVVGGVVFSFGDGGVVVNFGVVGGDVALSLGVVTALRLLLSPSPPSPPCTTQKQNKPFLSLSVGRLSVPPPSSLPSSPPFSPPPKKQFFSSKKTEIISKQ